MHWGCNSSPQPKKCTSTFILPSSVGWATGDSSLKTHLPPLELMIHTAFTNSSAKKQEEHPKYHNGSAEAPGIVRCGCSHCLDARLDLGAGCLCQQLPLPLWGSVGSQRVSADHQVQLVSSL